MFGAGLLVGTALSVIIPEGVDAMYSSRAHVTSNPHLQSNFKLYYVYKNLQLLITALPSLFQQIFFVTRAKFFFSS